eukprot:5870167-Amphidinium_carterae.2
MDCLKNAWNAISLGPSLSTYSICNLRSKEPSASLRTSIAQSYLLLPQFLAVVAAEQTELVFTSSVEGVLMPGETALAPAESQTITPCNIHCGEAAAVGGFSVVALVSVALRTAEGPKYVRVRCGSRQGPLHH